MYALNGVQRERPILLRKKTERVTKILIAPSEKPSWSGTIFSVEPDEIRKF